MEKTYSKKAISYDLAAKMVEAAIARAKELNCKQNVAVVDDGGNLKAFSAMLTRPLNATLFRFCAASERAKLTGSVFLARLSYNKRLATHDAETVDHRSGFHWPSFMFCPAPDCMPEGDACKVEGILS